MKVAIIGGGIVGLFTAYFLQKEDVEVTLYEKAEAGSYSIHAAGLIEPYRFDKINSTEMIIKMLKYTIRGDTYIKSVNKLWLTKLITELNKNPPQEAWEKLKEMAKFSLLQYKEMSEEKNDFDYFDDGLYEAYNDKKSLEKGIEEEKRSPFSVKFEVENIEGFAGAIYFPELSRISTEKFIKRILNDINKVKIIKREIESLDELKDFDSIVLASGIWTNKFVNIPLTAFKGYGYRVNGNSRVKNAIVIVDDGVAISPLSDYIKITGGFDADFSFDSGRAELFLKKAAKVVDINYIYEMDMGFRPCSPDGFPILGKKDKITIATGACRLGWSYAPAIGKYSADLALNRIKSLGYMSRFVENI